MTRRQMVVVEWQDSTSFNGWRDVGEVAELTASRIESLGFRQRDRDGCIVLAGSVSDIAHYARVEMIPKGCVKSVRRLVER